MHLPIFTLCSIYLFILLCLTPFLRFFLFVPLPISPPISLSQLSFFLHILFLSLRIYAFLTHGRSLAFSITLSFLLSPHPLFLSCFSVWCLFYISRHYSPPFSLSLYECVWTYFLFVSMLTCVGEKSSTCNRYDINYSLMSISSPVVASFVSSRKPVHCSLGAH